MYRKLAGSEENLLGYHVSGTLTATEIGEMQREIEAAIRKHGSTRILIEVGELGLPDPGAVMQDLRFAPRYLRDVQRFALVGNAQWQEWALRGASLLARGEVRYFDSSELPQAWSWLRA